ncbi:terpene synthase family protein [Nocardia thraciensis]
MSDFNPAYQRLEYGTEYSVPPIPVQLPLATHGDYEALAPQVLHWLRPYFQQYFREPDESGTPRTDRKLAHRDDLWMAMCYPHARADRIFPLLVLGLWLALVDDSFSSPDLQADPTARRRACTEICQALDGVNRDDYSPIARMTFDGHRLFHLPSNPAFNERLATVAKQTVTNSAEEETTLNHQRFDDIPGYLKHRRTNVYGYWLLTLAEFGLGIDVGNELTENPDLRAARDLVIDHWIYVNDIYSFPKEIAAHEKVSSVWQLMDNERMTLQQSLDHLAARAVAIEHAFTDLADKIVTTTGRIHPDIEIYLHELGHMIPANLRFHRWSSRYHDHPRNLTDSTAGNTEPEQMTLYRHRTVH